MGQEVIQWTRTTHSREEDRVNIRKDKCKEKDIEYMRERENYKRRVSLFLRETLVTQFMIWNGKN